MRQSIDAEQPPEEIQESVAQVGRKRWRKSEDTPLGKVLEWRHRRPYPNLSPYPNRDPGGSEARDEAQRRLRQGGWSSRRGRR